MNQRRKLLKSLAAGSLAAWGMYLEAKGNHPLPPGVRKITGTVAINGATAREGQVVLAGDTVSTGDKSEVIYVMGNNAYLMRENTKVSYAAEGVVGVMRVVTGKILSVFGPGPKRIETSSATVGIRGTGCYIEAEADKMYFCLCYGSADVTPLADPTQMKSLLAVHHDTPMFIGQDTSKALLQQALTINHRDYELALLEATVGRVPPFDVNGVNSY